MEEKEKKVKGITVNEFYDHITKHMTPEEALKKLLVGPLMSYEKLKFNSKQEAVQPELIIAMAGMDLGWQIAIRHSNDPKAPLQGITVGTPEYMDKMLNFRYLGRKVHVKIDERHFGDTEFEVIGERKSEVEVIGYLGNGASTRNTMWVSKELVKIVSHA
jgi:hypothetical protein